MKHQGRIRKRNARKSVAQSTCPAHLPPLQEFFVIIMALQTCRLGPFDRPIFLPMMMMIFIIAIDRGVQPVGGTLLPPARQKSSQLGRAPQFVGILNQFNKTTSELCGCGRKLLSPARARTRSLKLPYFCLVLAIII